MAADAAGETDRAPRAGDEPQPHLGKGDPRPGVRLDAPGEGGQLDARAGRVAVQVGHRAVADGGERACRVPQQPYEVGRWWVGPCAELVEIAAAAEGRTGTPEVHNGDLRVERGDPERFVEPVAHRGVERVAHPGSVEGDLELVTVALDEYGRPFVARPVDTGPSCPPAGELGTGLEQPVGRRLGDQAVCDRASVPTPEQEGQSGGGQRVGGDGGGHPVDHGIARRKGQIGPTRLPVGVGDEGHHDRGEAPEVLGHGRIEGVGQLVPLDEHKAAAGLGELVIGRPVGQAPGERRTGYRDGLHAHEGNVRRPWARGTVEMLSGAPSGDATRNQDAEASAWEATGLRALTGRPDGPGLDPPPGLVSGVTRLAAQIGEYSAHLGVQVRVDPLGVLAARAAEAGLHRGGDHSCGGSARLLAAADGWVAVNLARPDDWVLAAAWLELPVALAEDDWGAVTDVVGRTARATLVDRATLLGLPVAALGERTGGTGTGPESGIRTRLMAEGRPFAAASDLVVADLSALWAGPLVGALLGECGARVLKVESSGRVDGARSGPASFFACLNSGKESVVVDLATAAGRRRLLEIVAGADVVLTSARPRALEQLGLDPEAVVRDGRPRVWLSITGYGSEGRSAARVAFGDDAAVAGGLVVWDDRGPCFCADAVADPATGLAAAAAVLEVLDTGSDAVVEASMADVAAGLLA